MTWGLLEIVGEDHVRFGTDFDGNDVRAAGSGQHGGCEAAVVCPCAQQWIGVKIAVAVCAQTACPRAAVAVGAHHDAVVIRVAERSVQLSRARA